MIVDIHGLKIHCVALQEGKSGLVCAEAEYNFNLIFNLVTFDNVIMVQLQRQLKF